jgi:hypothetical protein
LGFSEKESHLSNGTNVASQLVNFISVFTSIVHGSDYLVQYFVEEQMPELSEGVK